MGSDQETFLKLPIIDFSKPELKPNTVEWDLLRVQVIEALQEYGCFEAVFNKVPDELRKAIVDAAEELFDLPVEVKLRNSHQKLYLGYVGHYPAAPLHESIGVGDANIPEKAQSFTNLMWPRGNPKFCKTIQSYSGQLSVLDRIVRRVVLESFGLENYLNEHMESTNYLLRAIKYLGPQTNECKVGMPTHTDKNIVTILHQNQVQGLEVKTRDGQCRKLKLSPDSFMVLTGDSFHAWTNGGTYPTCHRVMMRGFEERYSLALFSIPKEGYVIRAPEEVVDEEHPLLYKPFEYSEYLKFCSTEFNKNDTLKSFCGI